ncbi:MAG: peptidylprolyl isomerase, partial [Polyangiaceae bacterium]
AHPPSDNATRIKAWHILIAYKGAEGADPKVTRSREEAKALAEHVDIQARAGADFAELVAKYSDDPKAKINKGNLGELTRTSMVKPFTDAAFGLMKQEIGYDPVETAFGFHIIKRTE